MGEENTHEAFGMTKEETEKAKDFKPTVNLAQLQVGNTMKYKGLSEKPRMVEVDETDQKGQKTGKKVQVPVIEVVDVDTGLECTIWLSSKSLQMEFYKLHKKVGTLKDVVFVIGAREYKHEKYGDTRAYTVQEDTLSQDN